MVLQQLMMPLLAESTRVSTVVQEVVHQLALTGSMKMVHHQPVLTMALRVGHQLMLMEPMMSQQLLMMLPVPLMVTGSWSSVWVSKKD